MNISNLQYSVRDIISQDNKVCQPTAQSQAHYVVQVPPPHSQKKQEEAVHCWIVNLVKEEALEEKVAVLSKRCMTRFLESLEPESLPAWRSSQLLAAACLLVTSKIVSSRPLGGRKLLKYSGGAFSMEELMVSSTIQSILLTWGHWTLGKLFGFCFNLVLSTDWQMTDSSSLVSRQQQHGPSLSPVPAESPCLICYIFAVLWVAAPLQAGLGRIFGLPAGRTCHHVGQSHLLQLIMSNTTLNLQNLHWKSIFSISVPDHIDTCDIST